MSRNWKQILIILSTLPVFFIFLKVSLPLLEKNTNFAYLISIVGVFLVVLWPMFLGWIVGIKTNTYTMFPVSGDPKYKTIATAILWLILAIFIAGIPALIEIEKLINFFTE